ncbi:MAG: ABC transporter substrate-binding protein [Desulfobacteraceae bacterium]|nr:ABC transporter substrate-binding protein [Desulfobacteraceae bacterium]
MRKKILILLLIIGTGLGYLLLTPTSLKVKKQPIYIAVAGPVSGSGSENGEEMLRGMKLYLNHINSKGGIKGRKIELLVYDDKDRRTAIKIATRIAHENKALLVIGHYNSTNSAAAGIVYKKIGMPAITASATAEKITSENDWYFRILSGNRLMADFTAHHIRNAMNRTSAAIIYDKDKFSTVLNFRKKAIGMGIQMKKKFEFDTSGRNTDRELNNIIGRLRASEELGTIVFATNSAEAAKLFASLRYPGTDYHMVGPDSLSTPSFINLFNNFPREKASPGYYSDGVYAVSHFFPSMSGKKGLDFRKEFIQQYNREPSWIAACYYDALKVAATAIERAEVSREDIINDRKRIRDALLRFDHSDVAVKGITGDIYFDKFGNAAKPLFMGVWHKQILVPAFCQYREPILAKHDDPVQKKNMGADDHVLKETRVVYVGIDINEIYNLDTANGVFTADFFLWFRFQGDFDDTGIVFTNAVNRISQSRPFMEYTGEHNVSVRSYRVIGDFKAEFDTNAYPFDQHILRISLRHAYEPETKLVYVPDYLSLPQIKNRGKTLGKKFIRQISGWNVTDLSFSQDVFKTPGSDRHTPSYSLFSAEIQIGRKKLVSVFIKRFFPVIAAVFILYVVYLIRPDQLLTRAVVIMLLLVVTGAIHYMHMRLTPTHKLTEYSFFIIYILAGISALVSALAGIMHKQGVVRRVKILNWAGRWFHVFFAVTACIFLAYKYVDKSFFLSAVTWLKLPEMLKIWLSGIIR